MRIEQLTFTRFLAAILIVIYHFGLDIFPFNHPAVSFIFKQANICVSYFFVLSGFVMMIAYGRKSNISFFKFMQSRFARLYPVYLLALLLYLWLTRHYHFGLTNIILSTFIVQSWVPGKPLSLNYPGWALSVEIFFILFSLFYLMYSIQKNHLKK
jgi:Predicted acyltransferases